MSADEGAGSEDEGGSRGDRGKRDGTGRREAEGAGGTAGEDRSIPPGAGSGPAPRRDEEPFREEPARSGASWLAYFTVQASPAMGAAWTMTGAVAGCGLLGWGVDAWAGSSPVGVLTGLGIGLAVGFYELAKVMFGRKP